MMKMTKILNGIVEKGVKMLTENKKKYWFDIFFKGVKIGEGDEESKNEVVRNFIEENHQKGFYGVINLTDFTSKLVSYL